MCKVGVRGGFLSVPMFRGVRRVDLGRFPEVSEGFGGFQGGFRGDFGGFRGGFFEGFRGEFFKIYFF